MIIISTSKGISIILSLIDIVISCRVTYIATDEEGVGCARGGDVKGITGLKRKARPHVRRCDGRPVGGWIVERLGRAGVGDGRG